MEADDVSAAALPLAGLALRPARAAGLQSRSGAAVEGEALDAIIALSGRYLRHRRFPDKAIDILDQTVARLERAGLHLAGELAHGADELLATAVADREAQLHAAVVAGQLDRLVEQPQHVVGEPFALHFERAAVLFERALAGGLDDTVPGQRQSFGCMPQGVADLSGSAGNSGDLGNLHIVRDTAVRNVLDRLPDAAHAGKHSVLR